MQAVADDLTREELIERALRDMSPAERKDWLIGAYAHRMISAADVVFWFYRYGLKGA